jgi:hypothetical protein
MHLEDREKTTFTTPWGTFMYDKMPFGLINAGEIFKELWTYICGREGQIHCYIS